MSSVLSKIMGSRKLNKAVIFTHLYLVVIAILVNSMIYLSITRPSFDQFYSGSVVSVPQELSVFDNFSTPIPGDILQKVHGQMLNQELEEQAELYEGRLEVLESQLADLSEQNSSAPEREVIVREVIRLVEVPQASPINETPPTSRNVVLPVVGSQQLRADGAMQVKDSSCSSGFAWVTPRLVRTCQD